MPAKKRLLIVDDVEANRQVLSSTFAEDFEILTACDGAQAKELVREYAQNITVILLDIIMPVMSGIDFLKWMSQSEYHDIPVIAVTSDEAYQIQALKNGAWDFIAKPTDSDVIRARVHNVIARYALIETRLYQDIVKDSPSAIYVCDANTHELLYLNQAGRVVSDLVGKGLEGHKCYKEFMHRDTPCPFCKMEEMTKDSFCVRSFTIPDTERTYIMKGKLLDWNGIDAHIEYITDDTERSNAHNELRRRYQEEINYRKTLGENLIASHRVNLTKGIVEESHSAIHKTPLAPDAPMNNEIFGKICDVSIPDEKEREEYYNKFNPQKMLEDYYAGTTSLSMEYRASLADGIKKWVKVRASLIKKPDTGDVMAFFNSWDINDKKTAQSMIDTVVCMDYDYLALLDIKNNDYTIYAKTEAGTPLPPFYSSNYQAEVEAYAREFLVEDDIERNIREMSFSNLLEKLAEHDIYTTYCAIKEPDGRISRKKLQFSYLDRDEQKIIITRADVTDVFENEKLRNDALAAALTAAEQANAAKSDFLSRMSHEIRTPMNAIIGMTAIGAQSIGDDEQVADCLSKIGISSRFLLSLINDILDMSRIESGKVLLKKEKIPFEEFINEINTICYGQAKSKNVDYECVIEHNTEDYYIGDAMKLQQVVINILSNAIKFTPQNGKVSLHVRQVSRMKNDAVLRFVINDTGCGISEEFLPHLFEPFAQEHTGTTTMYRGTGLGLAICKNLVDLMDGKINVRSIVGVGSEFTVDLKLGITEETKHRVAQKLSIDFTKMNALVVDDDVSVCQHAHIVLADMGVESEWVDSGKKAIERVQAKWQVQKYYDLILIDWKMPEMDGIETARRIRQIVGPDVTIIIMTAYDWIPIEREAKMAGVNLLMSKPMFKSTLISAFEKAFGDKTDEKLTYHPEEYNFAGKRLLLAEDHPLNVEVAKRLLESKGCTVEVAENGVRAVEMFTVSSEGYYDAILMDIRMPVMDGLQATRSIRHLTKPDARLIPIIAMTANAFDDDIEKSKEAGMNAHLAKPIEPNQLYRTLYDFIGAGNGGQND